MYSLVIAAVQLDMPFSLMKSLVVSTTETSDREGWKYIDNISDDQVCPIDAASDSAKTPRQPLPIFGLHYCQRYFLGRVSKLFELFCEEDRVP